MPKHAPNPERRFAEITVHKQTAIALSTRAIIEDKTLGRLVDELVEAAAMESAVERGGGAEALAAVRRALAVDWPACREHLTDTRFRAALPRMLAEHRAAADSVRAFVAGHEREFRSRPEALSAWLAGYDAMQAEV